ncbi:hypothetical protein HRI_004817300 [Hibiscus trionum]|uniref:Uncharacterized protein n=1 Tax=Hibiscus trionum TaxID=183268 RepID=A0A9W7J9Z5_HIBTR|nr:hypothetical protein HRI_004817300 [Hibiscus trionum]
MLCRSTFLAVFILLTMQLQAAPPPLSPTAAKHWDNLFPNSTLPQVLAELLMVSFEDFTGLLLLLLLRVLLSILSRTFTYNQHL